MSKTRFDINFESFKNQIESMTGNSRKLFDIILASIEIDNFYTSKCVKVSKNKILTLLKIDPLDNEKITEIISAVIGGTVFKDTDGTRSTILKIKYSECGEEIEVVFLEAAIPYVLNFIMGE